VSSTAVADACATIWSVGLDVSMDAPEASVAADAPLKITDRTVIKDNTIPIVLFLSDVFNMDYRIYLPWY
jgi:hypothetical protein